MPANPNPAPFTAGDPFFDGEAFRDVSGFRQWLDPLTREEAPASPAYAMVDGIAEVMGQLRARAEREHKARPFRAKRKNDELPAEWGWVDEEFENKSDDPPQRLVTQIAKEHLPLLASLLDTLRRVLRRERRMAHISNAQQLDAHCLRWLIRQPGHDAAEKAGARQRILTVVREENFNTLENRVLKDFFRRCARASKKYLRAHGGHWPAHDTIKSVRKLLHVCQAALADPLFDTITALKSMPAPNYVLQYDNRYSVVWQKYRDLVRQTEVAEHAWPFRHLLFREFMLAALSVSLRRAFDTVYDSPLWIHHTPERGMFFRAPCFYNTFYKENGPVFHFEEKNNAGVDFMLGDCKVLIQYIPDENTTGHWRQPFAGGPFLRLIFTEAGSDPNLLVAGRDWLDSLLDKLLSAMCGKGETCVSVSWT